MAKTVVLVGHCGADSSMLRAAVLTAAPDAQICSAHDQAALRRQLENDQSLVLVNRQLFYGFATEEGSELIRQMKAAFPAAQFMLISNYPEAQRAAVQAGALLGFGKQEVGSPRVHALLHSALNEG